jgi:DNA polymerase-3 subunit alpha (Gram-positive type)
VDKRGIKNMIKDYVALDLETTGVSPASDKIIEIGMARVIDGRITEKNQTMINPGEKLQARIVELTGITDEMLVGKPEIAEVIEDVAGFTGGLPLLGHNIIFDYSFLKKACVNHNIAFEKEGIDTLKLARRLLPELEHKNLDYLCAYFKINPGNSHRALDDACSAHELFWKLYELKPDDEGFNSAVQLQYQVKKDTPITEAQKRYLASLTEYHHITPDCDIESLTKSKASRLIDNIISEYGKIPFKRN